MVACATAAASVATDNATDNAADNATDKATDNATNRPAICLHSVSGTDSQRSPIKSRRVANWSDGGVLFSALGTVDGWRWLSIFCADATSHSPARCPRLRGVCSINGSQSPLLFYCYQHDIHAILFFTTARCLLHGPKPLACVTPAAVDSTSGRGPTLQKIKIKISV